MIRVPCSVCEVEVSSKNHNCVFAFDKGFGAGKVFGAKAERERIMKEIEEIQNPYPKDIFLWSNTEPLNFRRGRFNKMCFEIVENILKDLKKKLLEAK